MTNGVIEKYFSTKKQGIKNRQKKEPAYYATYTASATSGECIDYNNWLNSLNQQQKSKGTFILKKF